ncbi:histone-like nucleoid-structuring protein Lsr2 [Micromonospora coerulea]|uniref:histone-like nucleoid-structuring protein Lsr2 n=1 Tax=Micromonospora coerulea TaxID=47856 RepID=UPI0019034819|nr:Lsr2 family protein [Micromonospora veneta]
MARQVITRLVDDIDGGEASQTVEFALDGVTYSIDVSDENAVALREAFAPYVAAGSRTGRVGGGVARVARGTSPGAGKASREDNQAIREWAKAAGYEISERGRIPVDVVEAYRNRGQAPETPAKPAGKAAKRK